ncbi:MAG: 6-carboxytetrahydropterin synthase QueD, partial [bacterium]|nr:6-carboxytetrahydropterin synthase QueD [bacterium]
MEIYKEFKFDAAHSLPNLPEGHRCGNLHGHTFCVFVHLVGTVGESTG